MYLVNKDDSTLMTADEGVVLMKRILKFFFILIIIGILTIGIFLGYIFLKVNGLKKDIEVMDSINYEVMYHIRGDSDILKMSQYESETTPLATRWLASYIKKMEQGGCVSGKMHDDVLHGFVYAEGEETASIEFYYNDKAIFGIKKTMDYIIDTVEKESGLKISMLKEVTPDGYVSLEQIKTLLGEEHTKDKEPVDLIEQGKDLIKALKWVIPASGKDNYFEDTLKAVKMTYCSPIVTLNGIEGAKIIFGISNTSDDKYIYVRINDLNENEGSDLEVLIHIQAQEDETIVMPETISNDVIEALASVIQLLNSFGK